MKLSPTLARPECIGSRLVFFLCGDAGEARRKRKTEDLAPKNGIHSNGTQLASPGKPSALNHLQVVIAVTTHRVIQLSCTFVFQFVLHMHVTHASMCSGPEPQRTEYVENDSELPCLLHPSFLSRWPVTIFRVLAHLYAVVLLKPVALKIGSMHATTRVLAKGRRRSRVAVAHDGREHQRIGADVRDYSDAPRQQDREGRHCPGTNSSSSVDSFVFWLVVSPPPGIRSSGTQICSLSFRFQLCERWSMKEHVNHAAQVSRGRSYCGRWNRDRSWRPRHQETHRR